MSFGGTGQELRWLLGICSIRGGCFSSSNASRFKYPLPLGEALTGVRVLMPEVVVQGVRFAYETAGDGFPLVLAPGPQGRRDVWLPYMPLLGELCRVIAF